MSGRDAESVAAGSAVIPSADAAAAYVAERALCSAPLGTVGLELEGHLLDRRDLARRVPWDEVSALVEGAPALPSSSVLSVEPGGQLELSTQPAVGVEAAVAALISDEQVLQDALRAAGYGLVFLGLDPARRAERVNPASRYVLMERHFDRCGCGPPGRTLMSGSAGLQLNIEAGPPDGWPARLDLLDRLGPVLLAMSACSPLSAGSATGAASMRQQAWFELEAERSAPVPFGREPGAAWAAYALAAPLMLVRTGSDTFAGAPFGLTFADWVAEPERVGRPPTTDDLDYHLTTLFPVIRPRGFLELRFLDASPARFWPGLAAIVATLLDHPSAADRAGDITASVRTDWRQAALVGLRHPELRTAATACAEVALAFCPDGLRGQVAAYAEILAAGLSPGVLLLEQAGGDEWRLLEEALDA